MTKSQTARSSGQRWWEPLSATLRRYGSVSWKRVAGRAGWVLGGIVLLGLMWVVREARRVPAWRASGGTPLTDMAPRPPRSDAPLLLDSGTLPAARAQQGTQGAPNPFVPPPMNVDIEGGRRFVPARDDAPRDPEKPRTK